MAQIMGTIDTKRPFFCLPLSLYTFPVCGASLISETVHGVDIFMDAVYVRSITVSFTGDTTFSRTVL